MGEPRTIPADSTLDGDQVLRRLQQKTMPQVQANIVFEALAGKDDGFSYIEALRKSSPQLIGFSTINPRYELDDYA